MSDSMEAGGKPLKLNETPEAALKRLQGAERLMRLNPFKDQNKLAALQAEIARLGAEIRGE
ncbi:hypothetical protein K2Y00_03780 [Patescibacteria group bacterium]|nr:hypothetical protein [Patescibacteria group bacterium]